MFKKLILFSIVTLGSALSAYGQSSEANCTAIKDTLNLLDTSASSSKEIQLTKSNYLGILAFRAIEDQITLSGEIDLNSNTTSLLISKNDVEGKNNGISVLNYSEVGSRNANVRLRIQTDSAVTTYEIKCN